MRDRIGELNMGPGRVLNVDSTVLSHTFDPVDDAISALVALGYKPADASRMIQAVAQEGLDSEALIRLALQSAVRK
jgi:Holliday junction DNA helicase RuvA